MKHKLNISSTVCTKIRGAKPVGHRGVEVENALRVHTIRCERVKSRGRFPSAGLPSSTSSMCQWVGGGEPNLKSRCSCIFDRAKKQVQTLICATFFLSSQYVTLFHRELSIFLICKLSRRECVTWKNSYITYWFACTCDHWRSSKPNEIYFLSRNLFLNFTFKWVIKPVWENIIFVLFSNILCVKMMDTQNYWEDNSAHSMQVKYERWVNIN